MDALLVTGGAGFIGSNLILMLLEKYPSKKIINLDKLTYASDPTNLESIAGHENYHFVQGDICNTQLVSQLFSGFNIQGVFHLAAESHVDNSIENPGVFVETNVTGTFTLLEEARKSWMEANFKVKSEFQTAKFIHVSTDEVYGSLGKEGLFTEKTAYAPNSPYSASKASSDFFVRSYQNTFGLPTVITHCSNNYGPRQHGEKLIPTIIRNALQNKAIPIYGDGKNIRDWLYVEDHCSALDTIFENGILGEVYNIGGDNEQVNIEIAKIICEILDGLVPLSGSQFKSYKDFIQYVEDRPGHDRRYAIDSSKLKRELNWRPHTTFQEGLKATIQWYLDRYIQIN